MQLCLASVLNSSNAEPISLPVRTQSQSPRNFYGHSFIFCSIPLRFVKHGSRSRGFLLCVLPFTLLVAKLFLCQNQHASEPF